MNDEFFISRTVVHGSSGTYEEVFNLCLEKHPAEIDSMTLDEIDRLQKFLAEYVKKQRLDTVRQ